MIKKIKILITTLAMALSFGAPALVPAVASAAENKISTGLCTGSNFSVTQDDSCKTDTQSGDKINTLLKTVIDLFSLVVGVISVIMIIVGGLKYITSAGDSGNVTSAKNTILYAVIGLVVVALAQFVVRFVLSKVSS